MKTNLLKLFMMLFAIGLFVTSCENVDLSDPEIDENAIEANSEADGINADVFGYVNGGTGNKLAGCPTITIDAQNLMTIDFGTDCLGDDGSTRSGIIRAQFSDVTWEQNSSATITFDGYIVDGNAVDGAMTLTFTGTFLQPAFNLVSTNMTLTYANGSMMDWESNDTFTMTADVFTSRGYDWSISGTSSGHSVTDTYFSREAVELTTEEGCDGFVSGELTLTTGEGDNAEVYNMNFISCGTVEITYKGITFTKEL